VHNDFFFGTIYGYTTLNIFYEIFSNHIKRTRSNSMWNI
jgi:hypothetical protein